MDLASLHNTALGDPGCFLCPGCGSVKRLRCAEGEVFRVSEVEPLHVF